MVRKIKKITLKQGYVAVRMPIEAYNNYVKRQEKMEGVIKNITKKKINVPLTKVFTISSEAPINLPDEYLISVAKRRKSRR